MLCLNSVLKVPLEGSKTSSDEKLGPTGLGCSAGSKVIAGLLRVKLSTSESKSNCPATGAAAAGRLLGWAGRRVGAGTAATCSSPATFKRFSKADPAAAGASARTAFWGRGLARTRVWSTPAEASSWGL